jgi:hypothetical protein
VGRYTEIAFCMFCGYLIKVGNDRVIQNIKKLRDEAVAAGEAKLSFIAKMRQEHRLARSFYPC